MKAGALLILLAGITMPLFAVAQTADETRPSPPKAESQNPKPAAGVYIVKYSAVNKDKDRYHEGETSGSGPLHIIYSDGTDVVVPNEKGDFARGYFGGKTVFDGFIWPKIIKPSAGWQII